CNPSRNKLFFSFTVLFRQSAASKREFASEQEMNPEEESERQTQAVEWLQPATMEPYPGARLVWRRKRKPLRSLVLAIGLFLVTAVSTVAAGVQFATSYAAGSAPTFDNFFADYLRPFSEPRLFLAGIPFAATLLTILLAHELGHFFA